MKKFSIALAMVISFLMSVNAIARDDNHLQDIKNWTPYFTENGITYSYEHKDGFPNIAMTYKFEDAIGYQYFYVKTEIPEVKRNEFTEEMRKDSNKEIQRKFENVKLGYIINWYRMDCRNEMIELIETYCYSETNEFIIVFDREGKNDAKPYTGKIPFDRDWIKQSKKEAELKDRNETVKTELKKYGAEALVQINLLEVNPYEFEGHIIAVPSVPI